MACCFLSLTVSHSTSPPPPSSSHSPRIFVPDSRFHLSLFLVFLFFFLCLVAYKHFHLSLTNIFICLALLCISLPAPNPHRYEHGDCRNQWCGAAYQGLSRAHSVSLSLAFALARALSFSLSLMAGREVPGCDDHRHYFFQFSCFVFDIFLFHSQEKKCG